MDWIVSVSYSIVFEMRPNFIKHLLSQPEQRKKSRKKVCNHFFPLWLTAAVTLTMGYCFRVFFLHPRLRGMMWKKYTKYSHAYGKIGSKSSLKWNKQPIHWSDGFLWVALQPTEIGDQNGMSVYTFSLSRSRSFSVCVCVFAWVA